MIHHVERLKLQYKTRFYRQSKMTRRGNNLHPIKNDKKGKQLASRPSTNYVIYGKEKEKQLAPQALHNVISVI